MQCSVVIPTYNSADWIAVTVRRITNVMAANNLDFELIIVNDGSTDNTLGVLNEESCNNEAVKITNISENAGQQNATLIGILEAKSDYILTIDDDLEYDPADIFLLFNNIRAGQFDLVYGIPRGSKTGIVKGVLYRFYLALLRYSGEKRKTSFRILNREIVAGLAEYKEASPFNLDFFLARVTRNIGYVDVQYFPIKRSRYSLLGYIKLLIDLGQLKRSKMA